MLIHSKVLTCAGFICSCVASQLPLANLRKYTSKKNDSSFSCPGVHYHWFPCGCTSVAMQKLREIHLTQLEKNSHTKDIFSAKLFQLTVVMKQHIPNTKGSWEDVARHKLELHPFSSSGCQIQELWHIFFTVGLAKHLYTYSLCFHEAPSSFTLL